MSSIVITYDGTDITADVELASARFSAMVNGNPGTCLIRVRDDSHTFDFSTGKEITCEVDSSKVWGGYLMRAVKTYPLPVQDLDHTPTRYWELSGVDYNILFNKRIIFDPADPDGKLDFKYAVGTYDDTIIADLFDNYLDISGDGLSRSGVERVDIVTLDIPGVTSGKGTLMHGYGSVANAGYTWKQAMDVISRATGAVYYIDPDKVLHYVDVDTADASKSLSDTPTGVDEIGYQNFKLLYNGSNLVNDMLVWGAALGVDHLVFSRAQDATSIADHGVWQGGLFSGGLYKQISADLVSHSYVYGTPQNKRGGKDDAISVSCRVFAPDFRVGQKVDTTVDIFGYRDVLPIRRMDVRFINDTEAIFDLVISHDIDQPWSIFEMLWNFNFPRIKVVLPVIHIPVIGFPPPGCIDCGVTDTFLRADTTSPNWGTADDGIVWLVGASTGGLADIDNNAGHLLVPATTNVQSRTSSATLQGQVPTSVLVDFTWDQWNPAGQLGVTGMNLVIATGSQSVRLGNVGTIGGPQPTAIHLSSGPAATSADLPYTFFPSTLYHLRFEVEAGVENRVRIWTGGVEPSTWDLTLSHTNPLGSAAFALSITNSSQASGAHNDAQEVHFSYLELSNDNGILNRCTEFMLDTFSRTNGSAWGTSTDGHTWSQNLLTGSTWSVDGARGVQHVNAGTSNEMRSLTNDGGGWTSDAWTMLMDFSITKPTSGGHTIIDIVNHSDIRVTGIDLDSAGSHFAGAAAGSPSTSFTFVSNQLYHLKWEMVSWVGTAQHYRAKLWADGTAEPGSWAIDYTDSSRTPQDPTNYLIIYSKNQSSTQPYVIFINFIDFQYATKPCYIVGGTPVYPSSAVPTTGYLCENPPYTDGTTYQLSNASVGGSCEVNIQYGGSGPFVLVLPGIARDYTVTNAAGQVVFASPLSASDVVRVCYIANGAPEV